MGKKAKPGKREPVRPVTQAELARLEELRSLASKKDAVRVGIRDRLVAGAGVEPGPLTVRVWTRPMVTVTWGEIAAAVGEAAAARLRGLVPAREAVVLEVTRDEWAAAMQAAGVSMPPARSKRRVPDRG